jgi:hypothetical protein
MGLVVSHHRATRKPGSPGEEFLHHPVARAGWNDPDPISNGHRARGARQSPAEPPAQNTTPFVIVLTAHRDLWAIDAYHYAHESLHV